MSFECVHITWHAGTSTSRNSTRYSCQYYHVICGQVWVILACSDTSNVSGGGNVSCFYRHTIGQ